MVAGVRELATLSVAWKRRTPGMPAVPAQATPSAAAAPQRRLRAPGARRERGENVAEGHGAQGQEPVVRSDAGRHTGRDGGLDGGLPNGVEEAEASEGEAVGDDNGDGWSAAAKRASGRAYVARPRLATKIGRRGWARTARREPSSSPTAPAWKISTQVCSPPNCAPRQAGNVIAARRRGPMRRPAGPLLGVGNTQRRQARSASPKSSM